MFTPLNKSQSVGRPCISSTYDFCIFHRRSCLSVWKIVDGRGMKFETV